MNGNVSGDAGYLVHNGEHPEHIEKRKFSHAEIVKRDKFCEDCSDGGDGCDRCDNFYRDHSTSPEYCGFKQTPVDIDNVTEGKWGE